MTSARDMVLAICRAQVPHYLTALSWLNCHDYQRWGLDMHNPTIQARQICARLIRWLWWSGECPKCEFHAPDFVSPQYTVAGQSWCFCVDTTNPALRKHPFPEIWLMRRSMCLSWDAILVVCDWLEQNGAWSHVHGWRPPSNVSVKRPQGVVLEVSWQDECGDITPGHLAYLDQYYPFTDDPEP